MREEYAPSEVVPRSRRMPIGSQLLLGLGGLLALLIVSMLVAIVLVVGLGNGETRLNEHDVPFAAAVAEAALNAKGMANDQRGFLLTGDATFVDEAHRRAADARANFTVAARAAGTEGQRQAVTEASAGFERWVRAVDGEFAIFASGDRQRAITASLGPDRELRKAYEQALASAQAMGDSSIRSASSSVAAAHLRSVWILIACLLVVVAVGAGVVSWLVRSIATPLFRLVALLAPDLPA